ncbi:MAG: hypothetical protein AD742_14265 [Methylibium sp. NZG]|nr:MAG: hypothetical protein AD742_14265 [Methylibium sp. NZG]
MHARPALPFDWHRGLRRWRRAAVWLIATVIALQGSVMAMARVAEPAHLHARADMRSERLHDPMLDGVRVVRNHHARPAHVAAGHHHSEIERHAHDLGDESGAVYLGDDAADADAAKPGSGQRAAADPDTPTLALPAPPAPMPFSRAAPAPTSAYRSHVGELPERPPR